jgi:ribose transport system permease protein
VAFVVVCAAFSILQPDTFPTGSNVNAILSQAAPLAIVAFGLTVVLSMGDFDLSFGPMASLANVAAVVFMSQDGIPWPLAIVLALLIGCVGGAFNGLLTAGLGGSAFIMTLASGTVMTGIEYLLSGQKTLFQNISPSFIDIGQGNLVGGIATQIFIAAVICVLMYLLAAKSEAGRYMKAIGGNYEAARLAGIRLPQLRTFGFILVGFLAAIAGVLIAATGATSSPDAGVPLLLPAYAGVFLGSTAFRPGEFNIPGTLVGIVLLQVLQNGLTLLSASPALINIIQGAVLIAAVLLTLVERRAK